MFYINTDWRPAIHEYTLCYLPKTLIKTSAANISVNSWMRLSRVYIHGKARLTTSGFVIHARKYNSCIYFKLRYILSNGEISSSHGGEYDVQSCLLGCTAV
jgi:hypothetical protein